MRARSRSYREIVGDFNESKGYGGSIIKAYNKAYDEEMPFGKNKKLMAFIAYVLFKTYFRWYKEKTRNIAFKLGIYKFNWVYLREFVGIKRWYDYGLEGVFDNDNTKSVSVNFRDKKT
jgi:hypothetical protein